MNFPVLSDELLQQRLQHPSRWLNGKIRMVLDTDTYNEIDDQFALVYALLAPEKLQVEAIYAAPFTNDRSSGPGDGMEKSYAEILRLLERLRVPSEGFVYRGSTAYTSSSARPEQSAAALNLVERAMASPEDDPLYVVAIGAITNVASAMLIEPEIMRRIVVVWLGGHPPSLPHTVEFNLMQDVDASRLIFDSRVPLVHVPCLGVASHLLTTKSELEETIKGRNAISDFLYERFCAYSKDHFAWAKEIWDVATIAYLIDEDWVQSQLRPSPILVEKIELERDRVFRVSGEVRFGQAPDRHPIRQVWYLHRNPIFRDLFTRLQQVED